LFERKILILLYKNIYRGYSIEPGATAKLPPAADFAGPFTRR
jgi:hypothetical protein